MALDPRYGANVTEYRNPVKGKICLHRDSTPGPLDLKSDALPNELKGYPDSRVSTSGYISTCDTSDPKTVSIRSLLAF